MAKALERAESTGESIEDAARAVGVAPSTVHAHKASKGAAGRSSPAGDVHPPPPSAPPTGSQPPALPQGGAVSGKPDLLELLRRIGRARNAKAWAEVEEGLRVHVAGGEEALVPWLARPVEAVEVGVDELAALGRGLDLAVEVMQRAEPGGPALRALREVASLGKSLATVKAKRPPAPKPDEVQEAIRAEMDNAVDFLLAPTREATARFTADRAAFGAWCEGLGAIGAEVVRRVDAMLGGAPS